MKRQMMAMVLAVSSALTDEAAQAPVDAAVKHRQHAVIQRHPLRSPAANASVCEKARDRFDERNISSSEGYFYRFDP